MPDTVETFEDKDFPVSRVVQSTDTRCGPACCCMVLNRLGIQITEDVAAAEIDQHQLEPDAWYADPGAVAACLNKPDDPDPIPIEIAPFEGATAEAALAKLVQTVADRRLPCLILVYGGAHWIVVDGVRLRIANGQSSLVGVQVVDPYESEPPRRFIPARIFLRRYLQPVDFGQHWLGQYVALGDETSELPHVQLLETRLSPYFFAHKLQQSLLGPTAWPELSEWALANTSESLLRQLGFLETKALRGGGAPFRATRVTPITGHQEAYYVTAVDGTGDPALGGLASVAIGSVSGEVLEISPEIGVFQRSAAVALEAATSRFGSSRIDMDEAIYWAPTRDGISLFSVLRKAVVDGNEYYISSSGRIFDGLSRPLKGG